jgi:hypothetical protein
MLGFKAHSTDRAARIFLRHDEDALKDMIKNRTGPSSYRDLTSERITELEEMILKDIKEMEKAEADNISDNGESDKNEK